MNGILGMTELALGTDLPPEQGEYLSMVKTSAEALLGILNDILDFSKIEAGKLSLESLVFHLRANIGSTLKALALWAHEKGLEITYCVQPEVPDVLIGDSGRLRQVLVNLVGNAIKFCAPGRGGCQRATCDGDRCSRPGGRRDCRLACGRPQHRHWDSGGQAAADHCHDCQRHAG